MSRRFLQLFLLLILWSAGSLAHAAVSVHSLRQWRAPDHTRLVLDLSGPLEHRLLVLSEPDRLVLDLVGAQLKQALPELDATGPVIAGMRSARDAENDTLRIVLDLKKSVQPRSFVLKPAGPYGHRLVVDLYDAKENAADEAKAVSEPEPEPIAVPAPAAEPKRESTKRAAAARPFVVAIDAGHGGEDPGALGRRYRTREKDVTLAIARELARLINRTAGMRAVLIRDGDYYVSLRSRFQKARASRADLFVSIHADAVPGRQASGASVYALSEKGATDAMSKFLADKENASDLIGGVSLNDKDDMLAKVLLDLSHTKTMHDSLTLAGDLLNELKRVGPVHGGSVRQAGFAVLKAPDIPSVLVETAFISNPSEEKKLRSSAFQKEMAQGILKGIKRYVARATGAPVVAQTDDEPTDASADKFAEQAAEKPADKRASDKPANKPRTIAQNERPVDKLRSIRNY
jgi:N-acetylmuramoyl-L-alanine amidase